MIALAVTAAGAFEYALIGPPGGSFKSIEYVRDGVLLAGGFNGRLYLTTNSGGDWTDISPVRLIRGMTVEQIVYHPATDSVYFIARDLKRGLLIHAQLSDILNGFNNPDVMLPEMPIRSLALSGGNPPRIFVGTEERLHYSLNGGRSWKSAPSQLPNPEIESLAMDPDDPDVLYAGSWQRPYKTKDFGKTWHPVHAGMAPDSDVFALFFDARNRLWAGTCGHAYRRSSNGGAWVKKRVGLKGKRIHCLARVKGQKNGDVLAGTDNGLHLFKDAADAWMQLIPDVVVQDIATDDTGTLYLATEGRGVLRYRFDPPGTDSLNNGLNASAPQAMAGSPDTVMWSGLMYQDSHNGLWRLKDGDWSKVSMDCNGSNIRDLVSTETHLYAATSDGLLCMELDPLYHMDIVEKHWFLKGKTIKTLYLESDGVTLLAGGFDGLYQVNTRTGLAVPYSGLADININCIWKCPVTGLLMAGAEKALYRLNTGSADWEAVPLPVEVARINRIAGLQDGSQIYLATSSGLMASYDGGRRFTRSTGNLASTSCLDIAIRSVAGDCNIMVLLGDHSIYIRKCSAYQWEKWGTLPFDAWTLYAPPDTASLCVGTPANGIVVLTP